MPHLPFQPRLVTIITAALVLFALAGVAISGEVLAPKPSQAQVAAVPAQGDWVDCGPILFEGNEGDWDRYLWGGFAHSFVKKGDTFYLYYQGSLDYDDAEGTVTWRSIGVATSTDGIRYTRYAGNPVLTWFPNTNIEEGAVSGGAFVDSSGQIAIYYGANTWAGGSSVSADGRLAVSADGLTFADQGVVLDHTDSALWGAGDEIFPVAGLQENGRWIAYYIPNGTLQKGKLGAAWGSSRDSLTRSAAVRAGLSSIAVWGPTSAVRLGPGEIALFTNDVYAANGPTVNVSIVDPTKPNALSAPVTSYHFPNTWEAAVLRDDATGLWYMTYRRANQEWYGVRVAALDGQTLPCDPIQAHPPFLRVDRPAAPDDRQTARPDNPTRRALR